MPQGPEDRAGRAGLAEIDQEEEKAGGLRLIDNNMINMRVRYEPGG